MLNLFRAFKRFSCGGSPAGLVSAEPLKNALVLPRVGNKEAGLALPAAATKRGCWTEAHGADETQQANAAGLDDLEAGTLEQKFLFGAGKKQLLLDWMQFQLARNPGLFAGPVLSLYYDTPALALLHEVRNGDYLKNKVRLRWYQSNFPDGVQTVTAYLEIKRKCGTVRAKQRAAVELPVAALRDRPFEDPEIAALPARFAELHCMMRAPLVPALIIEYERYRFVDAKSGARISLDTDIRCRRVNPAVLPGSGPVELGCGVLEIKGRGDTLPDSLLPLRRHLRRDSFSKYGNCCEYLIAPLLWREPA
jgi:hypothetical protein